MALGELKRLRNKLCNDDVNVNRKKILTKLVVMICAVVITAFCAICLKKKDGFKTIRNDDTLFQLF